MSVSLYDAAIVKKLRFWTQDSKVSVADPDTLFTYRADAQGDDKITLPCISLTRGPIFIKRTGKSPMSKDGYKTEANEKKVTSLRAIPITIHYQLDTYARLRSDSDNLMRELIFKLINNPRLEIEIPYNDSPYTHKFTLTLEEEVEDNSDVAQHLEKGEYYRTTLNIVVDDAYLFNYISKDTLLVEVSVNAE